MYLPIPRLVRQQCPSQVDALNFRWLDMEGQKQVLELELLFVEPLTIGVEAKLIPFIRRNI